MIIVHVRTPEGKIVERRAVAGYPLPAGAVWVDLRYPDDAERRFVSEALGLDLPTQAEMAEIEVSSRLYTEGSAIYLTVGVLFGTEMVTPELGDVTLVAAGDLLVTLRYCEPRALETAAWRLQRQPESAANGDALLFLVLDAMIDRTADHLEGLSRRYDELSARVFTEPARASGRRRRRQRQRGFTEVLAGIGRLGDTTHRVRESLAGLQRLIMFLGPQLHARLNADQNTVYRTLDRDVRSLIDRAQFLSNETSFLLQATLGMVNIEQNAIIKIFSIAAVVFLPPTLVGTVYGMNFSHMPELEWVHGYPVALGLMVLSALVPLWYFRHKGWL